MAYYDSSINTIYGSSEIDAYVREPLSQQILQVQADIDQAIQGALDKIVQEDGTIVYEPKPLNEISQNYLNNGPINMNDYRIENLATVDISSIDSILATPKTAVNVDTMGTYTTLQLALNTAYCGPLFSTMNCKDKILTGVADMQRLSVDDDSATTIEKLKQAVNYRSLNLTALVRDQTDDFKDFDASQAGVNVHIKGIDAEELTNLQMNEYDSGNPSEETQKLLSQAVSVRYALDNTLHAKARDVLDTTAPAQSSCFDSQLVNIQNGRRAVLPKDYVIKEQTITEEDKQIQYEIEEVTVAGPYDSIRFEDSDTIYTCSDPKYDPTGLIPNLRIIGTNPPQYIPKNSQLANLKYVDNKVDEEVKKRHSKTEDVDLTDTYKVINMPDPTASHHGVNKSYCDSNSGKQTEGGGNFFSALFGAIAGGVAGAITSFATQGLGSALGSVASAGASAFGSFLGSGLFQGGMRVGSQANLEALKAENPIPNEGQLIDNLKDDIANRPEGQPDVGSLVSGAMSVSGLFRAVRNAQIGLFDLIP